MDMSNRHVDAFGRTWKRTKTSWQIVMARRHMTNVTSEHPFGYQVVELLVPREGWGLDGPVMIHPAGTRGMCIDVWADGQAILDLDVPDGWRNEYHYDLVDCRVEDVRLVSDASTTSS